MKLLLFDLDGTLISTGGAGLRALDRAFYDLHHLEKAMDGISPAGKVDPAIVQEVFREKMGGEVSWRVVDELCEAYLKYLAQEMVRGSGYRVMDGVDQLLNQLEAREDILLALGTGNLERGARIKLEPSGLNDYFPFGGFGSDADNRPEVLRAAVNRAQKRLGTSIHPRCVFVIGDTVLDVRAGKAISAVTVAVGAGHGKKHELQAAEPDIYLDSFSRSELLQRFLR